jgi:hypothetical protein
MTARQAKIALLFSFSAFFSVSFLSPLPLYGQVGPGNGGLGLVNRVVGGVKIDAHGVVSNADGVVDPALKRAILESIQRSANSSIQQSSSLRLISLRRLEEALAQSKESGQPLAPEFAFMAGLQRIEFVVVSPEQDDIFIGGPAEGWKLNEQGIVVGNQSGNPVIQLEDFLAALRSSEAARTGHGISVSIDPTEQGTKNFVQLSNQMKSQGGSFDPQMKNRLERAMGDQVISLTGVPADSRFAQVLVAADYKMKRFSMGFEPAPINDLPSYMEMASKASSGGQAAPRFWMECNYQPVGRSEKGSIWQIRGQGVKTLTEESRFDRDGKRQKAGKTNQFATKWAEAMTAKFEQLAAAEPCFRELRNAMDMAVIAAIINREGLLTRTGLNLQMILNSSEVQLPVWNVPKTVPSQCSYVKTSNSWLVSASGGVQLDPWGVAQKQETVAELNALAINTPTGNQWWWNAAE